MHKVYTADYEDKEDPTMPDVDNELVSKILNIAILVLTHSQVDEDDFSTFANISVTKHAGSRTSELQGYLRKPVENVKDPLKWWVTNRHVYPNLYRMALDYLSIPGI